mgnify:CR=1 FL=1
MSAFVKSVSSLGLSCTYISIVTKSWGSGLQPVVVQAYRTTPPLPKEFGAMFDAGNFCAHDVADKEQTGCRSRRGGFFHRKVLHPKSCKFSGQPVFRVPSAAVEDAHSNGLTPCIPGEAKERQQVPALGTKCNCKQIEAREHLMNSLCPLSSVFQGHWHWKHKQKKTTEEKPIQRVVGCGMFSPSTPLMREKCGFRE